MVWLVNKTFSSLFFYCFTFQQTLNLISNRAEITGKKMYRKCWFLFLSWHRKHEKAIIFTLNKNSSHLLAANGWLLPSTLVALRPLPHRTPINVCIKNHYHTYQLRLKIDKNTWKHMFCSCIHIYMHIRQSSQNAIEYKVMESLTCKVICCGAFVYETCVLQAQWAMKAMENGSINDLFMLNSLLLDDSLQRQRLISNRQSKPLRRLVRFPWVSKPLVRRERK